MKTLLLISERASGEHSASAPISQSSALQAALSSGSSRAAVLTREDARQDMSSPVRLATRMGGLDAGLAMMGFMRRREYDIIYSASEEIGTALGWLFQSASCRPLHASAGHRLAGRQAGQLFRKLALKRGVDFLFAQTQAQRDFAEDRVGILAEKIALIPPAVDDYFFRPRPSAYINTNLICSAGWRCRDYPMLADAVQNMPDVTIKVADYPLYGTMPQLPGGAVRVNGSDYDTMRSLYAESSIVAVPLCDTDGADGAETILQAMAMGKAVIATRTEGQPDLITDGITGLSVAPGDVVGWRQAIAHLRGDPSLRDRIGRNARRWVEEHAALDHWAGRVAYALRSASDSYAASAWEAESAVSCMSGTW